MLRVELDLPWAWRPGEPEATTVDTLWREAFLVLRLALSQEPPSARDSDRETGPERGLERLEAKLDLALHLLSTVLGSQAALPPPGRIILRPDGLEIPADLRVQVGDKGCCELGLGPALPLPLRLPAVVVRLDAEGTVLNWLSMPDDLLELWTQWLFRQHRRSIKGLHGGH